MCKKVAVFMVLAFLTFGNAKAFADQGLAKKSQNPIGNMISLPMQNNTYFNLGPDNKSANSFQLQPFWYAEKPDNGPDWSLQLQVKFLFPK